MEARRTAGLNTAPPCLWSPTPPLELKEAPAEALSANAGFVTFGNVREIRSLSIFFHCNNLYCVLMQLFSLVTWKARNWIEQFAVYRLFMLMLVIMLRCDLLT